MTAHRWTPTRTAFDHDSKRVRKVYEGSSLTYEDGAVSWRPPGAAQPREHGPRTVRVGRLPGEAARLLQVTGPTSASVKGSASMQVNRWVVADSAGKTLVTFPAGPEISGTWAVSEPSPWYTEQEGRAFAAAAGLAFEKHQVFGAAQVEALAPGAYPWLRSANGTGWFLGGFFALMGFGFVVWILFIDMHPVPRIVLGLVSLVYGVLGVLGLPPVMARISAKPRRSD